MLISFAVLSDPAKRIDYDLSGIYEVDKYTLRVRKWKNHIIRSRHVNLHLFRLFSRPP